MLSTFPHLLKPYNLSTMKTDEYQKKAARTLLPEANSSVNAKELMQVWCALGLVGEAGEVGDHIKKSVFHRHGIDKDELVKELGDVLWYLSALCTLLHIPLAEVMRRNIEKIDKRYPQGFTSIDSIKRVDISDKKISNMRT